MPYTRTSPGNRSLAALQEAIQDQEVVLGYLINLAPTDAGNNRVTYAGIDSPNEIPPEGKGTVLKAITGHPPTEPGARLVCSGPIIVEGTLQNVAAYRVTFLEAAASAVAADGTAPADHIPTSDDSFRVPFVLLDAFERAGELAPKEAVPLARPSPAAVTIDFGPNARASDVTDFSRKVLEDIMRAAGLTRVMVSSTARGPADQARVMFNNLETRGVAKEKELYGPAGDQVIDTYDAAKRAGQDAVTIKRLMTQKIIEIGPTRVSRHASNPRVLNVFDVASSSVAHPASFEAAVRADQRVSRFFKPPEDPGYHLEIPQAPTV